MNISEYLADYAMTLKEGAITQEQRRRARANYLDGLACLLLGVSGASVQNLMSYACAHMGKMDCRFLDREKTPMDALHCAFLGAAAAHSNDFDDMSTTLNGHPSALLVPVTLALGQSLHASGRQVLDAYAVGVEIDAILGAEVGELGCRKGWNTTNLIGIFGATAAAGCMLGLDRLQLAMALCIAVNEASGFKANYGTKAKDFAIGMTAVKAITAAECAKNGLEANLDAFEGPFGLFMSVFGSCDKARLIGRIQSHRSEFVEPGLVIKPYPSCRGNHSGIDCITKIVSTHPFGPEDVKKITCRVDNAAFDTDRYEYPETPNQAKFSLAFCIARVIIAGKVTIDDFLGEEITDQRPLAFIPKVEILCCPERFPESRSEPRWR